MKIIEIIRVAIDNLRANKLRSGLSALGVIIGVSSIIAVISIAESGRQEIINEVKEMGSDLIWIYPEPWAFPRKNMEEFREGLSILTWDVVKAIKRQCSVIQNVAPQVETFQRVSRANKDLQFQIFGITPEHHLVRGIELLRGRFITPFDLEYSRKVCIIEECKKSKRLFGLVSPIGKKVRLFGLNFDIIGVAKEKTEGFGMENPGKIYIPITTLQRLIGEERVDLVYAKVKNPRLVKKGIHQVKMVLNQRYNNNKFSVESAQDVIEATSRIMTIVVLIGGGIAAISLLVGGIGIMNVMFVSVKERTREIGILKAIGVKEQDILLQFLIEAVTLSVMGGGIGIILGILIGKIFSLIADMPLAIKVWIVSLGFIFSTLTGVISGIYPARQAARLDPIEALRYE